MEITSKPYLSLFPTGSKNAIEYKVTPKGLVEIFEEREVISEENDEEETV